MKQGLQAAMFRNGETDPSAMRRRAIGISKRRESPRFIICDASMAVLYATPGLESIISVEGGLEPLKPQCRQSLASNETVFHPYDDETVLRIVPLSSGLFGCVAIFVDTYSHRGSVFEAAKRFGLTKREVEVLQLIMHCKSNSEIADVLSIAETTAADHVKSLMRKFGASKRIELVGRVCNLEPVDEKDSHG